jgi:hypothetical protein
LRTNPSTDSLPVPEEHHLPHKRKETEIPRGSGHKQREERKMEQKRTTMERLVDVEVTPYGTIIEEIEVVCTMTGFRRRVLVEHTLEGASRSLEVMA